MAPENKIITRPGICVFGSNGESIQHLDTADVDTKVITSIFGKDIAGGTAESLNGSWFEHCTDSNEMQRWHRLIEAQTEVFESGDYSVSGVLLEACRNMLLDCLNCEKFPEVSPWGRFEIYEFISAAKFALISVANAFQADAERLMLTIEASDNNTHWNQLFQKIDKQSKKKPAKVRLTISEARVLFKVEETKFRKMVKAGEYGLEKITKTRSVLMDKSEHDRRKAEKYI